MALLAQVAVNSLIAGATYALLGMGFTLIYGTVKFVHMTHGVFAAMGGYMVFYLVKSLGWNMWVGIAVGIIVAGLFGWLSEKFVYSSLRRRRASTLVMFIASLGLFTALQSFIAILFTSQLQTLPESPFGGRIWEIAGTAITSTQILIIFVTALVYVGLRLFLDLTKFGKAVKAVSDDEEVAKIVGINTERVVSFIFFLGSALAGLAGILVGFDTGVHPTMGLLALLEAAVSAIIGGLGNLFGSVIGGFLLAFVENFGVMKIANEWRGAIAMGVLLLFLLFKPEGIFGKR